jgi:hypothetical protein
MRRIDPVTDREAALLANPEVLAALKRGIEQAKAGDYAVLDLDADDDDLPDLSPYL